MPILLTPAQLTALLGEHVGSIRRGIREGRIPAFKVNDRIYVSRDEVFKDLLERREKDGQKKRG